MVFRRNRADRRKPTCRTQRMGAWSEERRNAKTLSALELTRDRGDDTKHREDCYVEDPKGASTAMYNGSRRPRKKHGGQLHQQHLS